MFRPFLEAAALLSNNVRSPSLTRFAVSRFNHPLSSSLLVAYSLSHRSSLVKASLSIHPNIVTISSRAPETRSTWVRSCLKVSGAGIAGTGNNRNRGVGAVVIARGRDRTPRRYNLIARLMWHKRQLYDDGLKCASLIELSLIKFRLSKRSSRSKCIKKGCETTYLIQIVSAFDWEL